MTMLKTVSDEAGGARRVKRRRLKNVAIVPTLLTLGNLLCGFAAIYFSMRVVYGAGAGINPVEFKTLGKEQFERLLPSFLAIGAWCIALGMVFDALDGRIARIRQQTSRFGVELDSLADVVTFGVAPAILIVALLTHVRHDFQVTPLGADAIGRGRWILLAMYVACAAIRLARFNVETGTEESAHRHFKGLPSPAAAGFLAALLITHERLVYHSAQRAGWEVALGDAIVKALPIVAAILALLMVSRMPYTHLITVYLRGRRPIGHVIAGLILIFLFVLNPQFTATIGLGIYVASGPVSWCLRRVRGPAEPGDQGGRYGADGRPASTQQIA